MSRPTHSAVLGLCVARNLVVEDDLYPFLHNHGNIVTEKKWNEWGFKPPMFIYKLARRPTDRRKPEDAPLFSTDSKVFYSALS